jgi:hypothetical protein
MNSSWLVSFAGNSLLGNLSGDRLSFEFLLTVTVDFVDLGQSTGQSLPVPDVVVDTAIWLLS